MTIPNIWKNKINVPNHQSEKNHGEKIRYAKELNTILVSLLQVPRQTHRRCRPATTTADPHVDVASQMAWAAAATATAPEFQVDDLES